VIPFKFKKPSEEPDAAQDLRAEGGPGMLSYQFFGSSGDINIDTSRSIGFLNLPCLLQLIISNKDLVYGDTLSGS
jgi:hypothetical protein